MTIRHGKTHLVLPDVQNKPGLNTDHLSWAGQYVADKKPDVVICAGDFWDMPSLSSYDKGKLGFEGRRYSKDVESGNLAMERFLEPIRAMGKAKPRLVFTLGNHEQRIERAVSSTPELEGAIGYKDLNLSDWEVYDFLDICRIDGVAYSHFFPRSSNGRITQSRSGAPSAKAQLVREGASCTSGHAQGLDIAPVCLNGKLQWGIIAGSYYLHDEGYLTPQGTKYWRGLIVKHSVKAGEYCPIPVDINYLKQRYGKKATK